MAVFVCPNCSHTQVAPDEYVGRIAKIGRQRCNFFRDVFVSGNQKGLCIFFTFYELASVVLGLKQDVLPKQANYKSFSAFSLAVFKFA